MGLRNRQRRREKDRRRAEHARRQASRGSHRAQSTSATGGAGSTDRRRVREALWTAADVGHDRRGSSRSAFELLAATDILVVAAEAEEQLRTLLPAAWQHGWQPRELVRHARRTQVWLTPIVGTLIRADHARRDPSTVHPRWAAQVYAIRNEHSGSSGWLGDLVTAAPPAEQLGTVVFALWFLGHLHALPVILPPPGTDSRTWDRRDDAPTDDPVLQKVRALLAQAESTTFPAEAETFTAKAQELMARHAIDAALLWAAGDRRDRPITIRMPIDDPYPDQKSLLLHVVAKHSRCKTVIHTGLGLESVVGFAGDVAATELLFTSLLVQSHAAMLAEGGAAPPGSRTRGRGFRSSFLHAYACRIDRRLADITDAVQAAAVDGAAAPGAATTTDDTSLLPVLAARAEVIDEEVAATFGKLRSVARRGGGSDWLGWERGVLAADRAQLRPDLPTAS